MHSFIHMEHLCNATSLNKFAGVHAAILSLT